MARKKRQRPELTDRFLESLPRTSMGVISRNPGLRVMGMAISYTSWIGGGEDSAYTQKGRAAQLIIIAACMTVSDAGPSGYGDRVPGMLLRLDRLGAAAAEACMSHQLTGNRKMWTDAKEADASALHHELMTLSRDVAATGKVAWTLAEQVEAIARTSDGWFRDSVVCMACMLAPCLRRMHDKSCAHEAA